MKPLYWEISKRGGWAPGSGGNTLFVRFMDITNDLIEMVRLEGPCDVGTELVDAYRRGRFCSQEEYILACPDSNVAFRKRALEVMRSEWELDETMRSEWDHEIGRGPDESI